MTSMRRTLEQQKLDIDRRYERQTLTLKTRAGIEAIKLAMRSDDYAGALATTLEMVEHLAKLRDVHATELQAKFANVTNLPTTPPAPTTKAAK